MISKKNYPAIRNAVFLMIIFFLILVVLSCTIVYFLLQYTGLDMAEYTRLSTSSGMANCELAIYIAAFLIILAIVRKKSGKHISSFIKLKKISPVMLSGLFLTAVGYYSTLTDFENVLYRVFPVPKLFQSTVYTLDTGGFVINLICNMFVLSFLIELLFRGILLDGFLKNYKRATAIIVSSFFYWTFTGFNLWSLPFYFIQGLILAWLYIETESLTPCVILQAFFCAEDSIFEWKGDKIPIPGLDSSCVPTKLQPAWFVITGAILLAAGIFLIRYSMKKSRKALIQNRNNTIEELPNDSDIQTNLNKEELLNNDNADLNNNREDFIESNNNQDNMGSNHADQ